MIPKTLFEDEIFLKRILSLECFNFSVLPTHLKEDIKVNKLAISVFPSHIFGIFPKFQNDLDILEI
eukprot:gene10929-3634_t